MTTRCALLVNPASGKGRHTDTAAAVRDRLTRRGGFDVTVMQGADADEARELARSAVEDGHDIVAAMGGDKTVHLTVQALAYSSTRLGIIATGTGNDVARYFGLPRGRPLEAADVIADGSTRRIDLGHTGATYFTTVLATGFDSLVNERANAMTWPHPAYQHLRVRTVSVAARGIVAYADGERIGPLPMTVEPAAGALGVCVPKGASW